MRDSIRWFKRKLKPPKNGPLENIFLHLHLYSFGVKIQNTNGQKSLLNIFDMCKIDTLQPSKQPRGGILKNSK